MINILFNYNGNIQEVKEKFNIDFISIPEMVDGSYMCNVANADDFDVIDAFMQDNGTIEVIAGWGFKDGKKYSAKKDKNKYNQTKYKKYLCDRWNYDSEGNKTTKKTKELWQVNRFAGTPERELL